MTDQRELQYRQDNEDITTHESVECQGFCLDITAKSGGVGSGSVLLWSVAHLHELIITMLRFFHGLRGLLMHLWTVHSHRLEATEFLRKLEVLGGQQCIHSLELLNFPRLRAHLV